MTKSFNIKSDFKPAGDQPNAINKIVEGLNSGLLNQTLRGVTGSGKTFAMANIIPVSYTHLTLPTIYSV